MEGNNDLTHQQCPTTRSIESEYYDWHKGIISDLSIVIYYLDICHVLIDIIQKMK